MSDYWSVETAGEMLARFTAQVELQKTKDIRDPEHWSMFEIDEAEKTINLYWGNYQYWIDLEDIQRPEDLLWKLHHVGKKTWKHMTPGRISRLIEAVARYKGWPMYGRVPHPNQMPPAHADKAAERGKVTANLRYKVIRRDGHRCRCCGASVSTGAVLHVDHIIPVSRGGTSALANLQTLCAVCNQGKAASTGADRP